MRDSDSDIERVSVFLEHIRVFFCRDDKEKKALEVLFAGGDQTEEALSSDPDSFSEDEDHFAEGIDPYQDM